MIMSIKIKSFDGRNAFKVMLKSIQAFGFL